MKHLVFLNAFLSLLLISCEEVPPFIDLAQPVRSKDTTYVSLVVPPAQHKAVLIEDVTGVRCNNCPQAAQKAKEIVDQKTPDSVVVMALYSGDYLSNFTTPWSGFKVLNSQYSTQIIGQLGVPSGLPAGYVDRARFGTQSVRYNPYTSWASLVAERLRESTPVNITIEKTLSGRKLEVRVRLVYTRAVAESHKFALYLTESGIVSKQTTMTSYDDNYVHNHVLRYAFGNAVGNPLTAPLTPGRVFEKIYEYELPSDYQADKCQLVCVVSDGSSEAVVNVREVHIQ